MVKIINKTKNIIMIGNFQLQQGINYIPKEVYQGFKNNGLFQKIINAVQDGKIEIEE